MRRPLFILFFMGLFASALIPGATQNTLSDSDSVDSSTGAPAIGGFAESDNPLADFEHRKLHTINGSVGAGTGYQVRVVTHYGSGTDSGEDVYLNTLCQPDFDDVRFVDNDGITPLAYWREDYMASSDATFWVKIADSLESSVTVYLYYGNAECGTTSNGTDTFIFFDDFESGSFDADKWYDTGDWQIVITNVKHGTYAAYCAGGVPNQSMWANVTSLNLDYGFLYHTWARFSGTTYSAGYPVLMRAGSEFADNVYSVMLYQGEFCHSWSGGPTPWPSNTAVAASVYYRTEVGFDLDTQTQYGWKSDVSMGSAVLRTYAGGSVSQVNYLVPNTGGVSGKDMWIDDLFLRKWTAAEPSHDEWGVAESLTESLAGFEYRKLHAINGSVGAGTGYQVRVTAHYGSGTDSGEDVYLDGLSQPDFDDIRFTDGTGLVLLDYWRESYAESQNATFWVELRANLDAECFVYVYWGNSTASSMSDGRATFLFFDDFEDGTLGNWDLVEDNWNVQGSVVKNGDYSARGIADSDGRLLEKVFVTSDSYLVHAWIRESDVSDNDVFYCGVGMDESDRHVYSVGTLFGTLQHYEAESWSSWPQNSAVASSTWYRMEFALDLNNHQHYAWKDHLSMGSIHLYNEDGNEFSSVSKLRLATYWAVGDTGWVDDYYVRRWVTSEPAHGVWGALESLTESLASFEYRKLHAINGSVGAGTGYQVRVTAHYGSGTDSGEDVYLDGLSQPDFDDIRFTDGTGLVLLDHWREDYSPSSQAVFWVRVLDNLSINQNIYVYFGNPWAISASNGSATFIAWDDFDLGYSSGDTPSSVRGWYSTDKGTGDVLDVKESPGRAGLAMRYIEGGTGGDAAMGAWNEWVAVSHDVAVHWDLYWETRERYFTSMLVDRDDNYPTSIAYSMYQMSYDWANSDGENWFDYHDGWGPSADTWHVMSLTGSFNASGTSTCSMDGTSYTSDACASGDVFSAIRFGGHDSYKDEFYIDDFFVRKHVSSEPAHDEWGSLEFMPDTSRPSIENVNEVTYELGTSQFDVEWTAFDERPGRYLVYEEDDLQLNETWDGSDVTVDVGSSGLGQTNWTVVVIDRGGLSATDSVSVSVVDTTSPSVDGPSDFSYEFTTLGPNITWTCQDLDPFRYLLYCDGSLDVNEPWTGGVISVNTTGLSLGKHNFTLVVLDSTGNNGRNVVLVSVVDTTDPVLAPADNIQYEYGTAGHTLMWDVTDAAPFAYQVYLGTNMFDSGLWNGSDIIIDVDGLPLGVHLFTVWVYDSSGNNDTDSVLVIVSDTQTPLLEGPDDMTIVGGTPGNVVRWNASDLLPDIYRLYVDDELMAELDWDGSNVEFFADGFAVGIHNVTLVVIDTSGNDASDTVYVAVEEHVPLQTLRMVAFGGVVVAAVVATLAYRVSRKQGSA